MFDTIKAKVARVEDLTGIRKVHADKRIVFCTGCYDILQSGHAVFFNQCKSYGDVLVVGVGRDTTLAQLKGPGRPINPENNRVYLVAALQDVDYAVLNDHEIGAGKIDFETVISQLRPDIFILNQDDSAIADKQKLCDKLGIKIQFVGREVPPELMATSTSRIINKINYAYKAPLRIDFAGGWADVPYIMKGKTGYVSNVAIKPRIEMKNKTFNFSGYPRGSGLSTSTAVKLLEMISSKTYNAEPKSLSIIAEDLFNLENKELNWAIGRQDQYAIVYGGFHCFECGDDYAKPLEVEVSKVTLEAFRKNLLLLHTGISRNAQSAVEQVYQNYQTEEGKRALDILTDCGYRFIHALVEEDFMACAKIMEENWEAQKLLAKASTNENLDAMYAFAKENGAYGGKICGAGGGGAFIFYCDNPQRLKQAMKKKFVDSFEIDFEFEYQTIKELNAL
ncbi:adenylyltransferase/cytidyltransferase family protein [Catalinimonas niigatensis]|uniref:adenylyltransferase/cytidyltransferase family protein n=1 Tax=Catalinimonas niigatensis TaxID=1397264 RepID=UPI00266685DF|nr:adenylyltransferase/cytidyltransferase family protein [Catalinimonas niigatensis]WPP52812.1 adenylyltransferase/cytidyltransferase family protein [Catalinimonas niigatensis]